MPSNARLCLDGCGNWSFPSGYGTIRHLGGTDRNFNLQGVKMSNDDRPWIRVAACTMTLVCCTGGIFAAEYQIAETIRIDTVPSWFPVGFCLLTHENHQFAAYYNERHQMVVARRGIDERQWQKVELPSKIGWDSHNYITMAVDAMGHLHLAGNMHCVPLIYFRTREPGDITTFARLPMTGQEEQRCTYPKFLHDADGNLLFTYRSGGSGNGRRFYNRYDVSMQSWARFLDSPLFEGEGRRNAYPLGPTRGPDGLFHIVWVWRETPDCATNHDLSYARSRDLKNWESAHGQPVRLPLTLGQTKLCVDPIPVGGGIINGCEKLAFDSHHRPMISYHKRDGDGFMQIYVARFRRGEWQRHAITTWDKTIDFGGGGAMPFIGIRVTALQRIEPDAFAINYRHRDFGSGRIVLDEETLRPIDRDVAAAAEYPRELKQPAIAVDGISVRMAHDVGQLESPDVKYLLRWETLGANHDRPRDPPLPPASELEIVKLARPE